MLMWNWNMRDKRIIPVPSHLPHINSLIIISKRMKKILLSLGLTLFCGVAVAQNSAIYKAQTLDQKNDFAGAAAVLEEALQNPKTTKFAEMYNLLAECNAKLFMPQLDLAANGLPFDTAKFVSYLDNMVNYYTKSHEADITPDKKGRVKPKFVQANHGRLVRMLDYYNYAAMFMYQNKDMNNAILCFEKYLDMPKNPIFSQHETDSIYASKKAAYSQTRVNLAQLNYEAKNWDKAISHVNEGLKDTLAVRDLYLIKMQAYLAKGDSAQWLGTLKEALVRTQNEGFAQNLLYHYYTKNDIAGATAMADDMTTNHPDSKTAWYIKGCVDMNMKKDYIAARPSFEKSLAIDPNFVDANVNMATTYINQIVHERTSGKFKYLGSGKLLTKAQVPVYRQELEYAQGEFRKAMVYLEKARELVPEKPRVWAYSLQMVYENLQPEDKNSPEAKTMADKLNEINLVIETM